MAAVTTKKPGSDLELQLSFPRTYEEAYAEFDLPQKFAPSAYLIAAPFPEGTSELDLWHRQKMMDAHRRVLTARADTKRATQRAMVSHQGYWAMPEAVLGQRIFANPSLGSGAADIYKPLHRDTPGLTGGVLRSKQGQEYGKQMLNARIAQLNAIDEAAAGVSEGLPMTDFSIQQGVAEVPGMSSMIKLTGLIQNLLAVLEGGEDGINRLAAEDFRELMLLLFRVGPQLNNDELQNILEAFDLAVELGDELELDLAEGVAEGERESADAQYAQVILDTVPLLRKYVVEMMGNVNKSPSERMALSRNLVRSLGFGRFLDKVERSARASSALNYVERMKMQDGKIRYPTQPPEAPQFQEVRTATFGAGRIGRMRVGRGLATKGMTDTFDKPALPREDEEWAGQMKARFNRDERQVFGDNSGRWYGQSYDNTEPASRAVQEVSNAARMGVRNPFRAPGAAADARGEREFEDAMERAPPVAPMSGSVAEARKARMAAVAQAQQAAREAAMNSMNVGATLSKPAAATGKGKGRKASAKLLAQMMKSKPKKGGSEASKKKVLAQMEKDLGESEEVRRLMAPDAPAPKRKRSPKAPPPSAVPQMNPAMHPIGLAFDIPPPGKRAKGEGKMRLMNQAGKAHRGAYHQMEDGSYHSGAKHTKRSKPLKVAE